MEEHHTKLNKHDLRRRHMYHLMFNLHPNKFKHHDEAPLLSDPHHFASAIEKHFEPEHLEKIKPHILKHFKGHDAEGGNLFDDIKEGVEHIGRRFHQAGKGLAKGAKYAWKKGKQFYKAVDEHPVGHKLLEAGKEYLEEHGEELLDKGIENLSHTKYGQKAVEGANKFIDKVEGNRVTGLAKGVGKMYADEYLHQKGYKGPGIDNLESSLRKARMIQHPDAPQGGGSSTGGNIFHDVGQSFQRTGNKIDSGIRAVKKGVSDVGKGVKKGINVVNKGMDYADDAVLAAAHGAFEGMNPVAGLAAKGFRAAKGVGAGFKPRGGGSSTGGALPPETHGQQQLQPIPENMADYHAAYNQSVGPQSGFMNTQQTQATANFPDPEGYYNKLYENNNQPKPSYNNKEDMSMSNNETYGMSNEAHERYNKSGIPFVPTRKGNNGPLGTDTLDYNEWQPNENIRWQNDQDMWGGWGNVVNDEHGPIHNDRLHDKSDNSQNKHYMYNTAQGVWMHHSHLNDIQYINPTPDQPELLQPNSITYSMNPYSMIEAGIEQENLTGKHLRSYADVGAHPDHDKTTGAGWRTGGNLIENLVKRRHVINNARLGLERGGGSSTGGSMPDSMKSFQKTRKEWNVQRKIQQGKGVVGGGSSTGGAMPGITSGGALPEGAMPIPQGSHPHPQHHVRPEHGMGPRPSMPAPGSRADRPMKHPNKAHATSLGYHHAGDKRKPNHYGHYRKAMADEISHQLRGWEPSNVWGRLVPESEGLRDKEEHYSHITKTPFHLGTKAAHHIDEIIDRVKQFPLAHEKNKPFIQRHLL